jgi:predicted TIM-barrel fold metal-dependent hydrolase
MSAADLFDTHRVIDVDTHVTEPPDLWTSRVASKWGDRIPHIERRRGQDVWVIDDKVVLRAGLVTMAGFDGTIPDHPNTFEEFPASSYDARARLEHMDRERIWAQVLYPNVGGFGSQAFLRLKEPELMLECVRAYNDFLIEWASADLARLIPVMALPFWDLDASLAEFGRCAELGHRAVLFPSQPHGFGAPALSDRHWDPLWQSAQDAGLSISFHIGGQDLQDMAKNRGDIGKRANFARMSSLSFVENSKGIAEIIFGGICHRFPTLRFVSVESGVGWIPALLEAFDWQWCNSGLVKEHPEYDLLPSEYFRRQVYACFWFERDMIPRSLELYPDNILYETDFPHPTSMSPGPQTPALPPREYASDALGGLPEATIRKVLHDNAATVYGLD